MIDFKRGVECAMVIGLPKRGVEVGVPIPPGVVGIELLGARRQREAALRVASIGEQFTEESDRVTIHRVECNSPFGRISKALQFFLEKVRLGQAQVSQMIGWSDFDGTVGGG